ncbi:hypothetical protein EAH84_04365 [Sphingomonas oligophenolica]|uniref:Uncharacterized protein n=1 Tax=Sphingomonas oligophenolica TaxID=301154 RepID=A0A502CP77_9SPHN|nr:hypothetical protein EAH84_04365 [Sphingomonas oligophenolica]
MRVGAAAAAIVVAALPALAPAIGQDKPESILPPGFGEPAPPPPQPRPTSTARPGTAAPGGAPAPAAPPTTPMVQPLPSTRGDAAPAPTPAPSDSPTPAPIDPAVLAQYEMPVAARRSLAIVGPAGPREGAMRTDAFGNADGRFLEALMHRTAAPLPSRWLSILLRRALTSSLATPPNVDGADFAAERAWLLLRMGESVAARAVVQGVDTANYTPKLFQVAMNSALATGDPAELCPLLPNGIAATHERGWALAQPMCAALAGNPSEAKAGITQARRRGLATGIDLQLAQKVVGAGPDGGQAVTIEWAGVDALTVWRFGLAIATGVTIPESLLSSTGKQATYWYALAPSIAPAAKVAAVDAAAGQGVLSSAALIDFYSALDEDDDSPRDASATAQDLREAYTATTGDARYAALRQIWGPVATPVPYARLVLTARAAARLPRGTKVDDYRALIGSMLTAGLDRSAARWRDIVPQGSDAWAMIVLVDPDVRAPLSYGDLSSYSGGGDAQLKQRLLFAGLAGLGRLSQSDVERAAKSLDVRIGMENSWTRALDRAVAANQPGTVALLAAIGMQTPTWQGVPPAMLYRIVTALRVVGLEGDARMIAAEAIARA